MKGRRTGRCVLVQCLALFSMALVVNCGTTPEPDIKVTRHLLPASDVSCPEGPDVDYQPFYAEGYLVVIGPKGDEQGPDIISVTLDVEAWLDSSSPGSVDLIIPPIQQQLELSYLDSVRDCRTLSLDSRDERPYYIWLIEVKSECKYIDVLTTFPNLLASSATSNTLTVMPMDMAALFRFRHVGPEYGVYADLSYQVNLGGQPWTAMGSPGVKALAHHPGPSPLARDQFEARWAFSPGTGIALYMRSQARTVSAESKTVRVGFFDTSPYTVDTPIGWMVPPFTLDVEQPTASPTFGWAPFAVPPGGNLSDHGLFVAGMVQAVAPGSDIVLYQVLNDHAIGDLYTLDVALHSFIQGTLTSTGLDGAVINLSLESGTPRDWLTREAPTPPDWHAYGLEPAIIAKLPKDVESLRTLVAAAYCHGMVVVAASGNDSPLSGGSRSDRYIPAIWEPTLAAGATQGGLVRSCFSNAADVYAPGGAGTASCEPAFSTCLAAGNCGIYGLLGPVSLTSQQPSGYAYWAGTSFSAPLVSGLAAQVICDEARAGWGTFGGTQAQADAVIGRIVNATRAMAAEHAATVETENLDDWVPPIEKGLINLVNTLAPP